MNTRNPTDLTIRNLTDLSAAASSASASACCRFLRLCHCRLPLPLPLLLPAVVSSVSAFACFRCRFPCLCPLPLRKGVSITFQKICFLFENLPGISKIVNFLEIYSPVLLEAPGILQTIPGNPRSFRNVEDNSRSVLEAFRIVPDSSWNLDIQYHSGRLRIIPD